MLLYDDALSAFNNGVLTYKDDLAAFNAGITTQDENPQQPDYSNWTRFTSAISIALATS